MAPRKSDSGRMAIAWLASTYVICIATGAAAFVIVAFNEKPDGALWVLGGSVSGLMLIIFLLNIPWGEPANKLRYWLFASDRRNPTEEYAAARRRTEIREKYGNNPPPSIDSVRDAANHGGAWVPRSNLPPGGRKNS